MRRQAKRMFPIVALAIVQLIAGAESATAQRGAGGPAPSPFDAFYTLGPDSLPRESVPKGEVRGPLKRQARFIQGSSTTIGFTFLHSTTRHGKSA